jgi:hypothetical protein
MAKDILAPAAVLVLWSLIVLGYMAFARFTGVSKIPKEKLKQLPRTGGRGQDLDPVLPARSAWPSHNYAHLMEQPTIFYATVMILALVGQGAGTNATLAWGYTGLRIAHSLWQITVNAVPVRFALFIASTVCLMALAINAVRATLF